MSRTPMLKRLSSTITSPRGLMIAQRTARLAYPNQAILAITVQDQDAPRSARRPWRLCPVEATSVIMTSAPESSFAYRDV